jgi:hypothetical protein
LITPSAHQLHYTHETFSIGGGKKSKNSENGFDGAINVNGSKKEIK